MSVRSKVKVVVGSIVGAFAVQLALVACGTVMHGSDGDGGLADGWLVDVLDAVPDASAQDGGGTCTCASPPRTTFRGNASPGVTGFAKASAVNEAMPRSGGTESLQWTVSVQYATSNDNKVLINCTFATDRTGQAMGSIPGQQCVFQVVTLATPQTQVASQTVNTPPTVSRLTDTAATINLPAFSAGAFSFNGGVVSVSQPSGRLTAYPNDFIP